MNMKQFTNDKKNKNEYQKCKSQIKKLRNYLQRKLENHDNLLLKHLSQTLKNKHTLYKLDRKPFTCFKTLRGHMGRVTSICWSPKNDNQLVSAAQDGKLVVWDVMTSHKQLAIGLSTSHVMVCSFSSLGNCVTSGGLDNTVSIWNIENKKGWLNQYGSVDSAIELIEHEGYVSSIKYIDNNHVLSGSGDTTVKLWDIEKQKCIQTYEQHNGDIFSIDVNKERSLFISGSLYSMICLRDYRKKSNSNNIFKFKGHQSDVNSVKWFADNNAFISGSDDCSVRLWDIKCMKELNTYRTDPSAVQHGNITSVDSSKSGYYIIAGHDGHTDDHCSVWNTMTAEEEMACNHSSIVTCVEVSPNGYCFGTASWGLFGIRLWC